MFLSLFICSLCAGQLIKLFLWRMDQIKRSWSSTYGKRRYMGSTHPNDEGDGPQVAKFRSTPSPTLLLIMHMHTVRLIATKFRKIYPPIGGKAFHGPLPRPLTEFRRTDQLLSMRCPEYYHHHHHSSSLYNTSRLRKYQNGATKP